MKLGPVLILYMLTVAVLAVLAGTVSLWLLLGLPLASAGYVWAISRQAKPVPRDAIRESERY